MLTRYCFIINHLTINKKYDIIYIEMKNKDNYCIYMHKNLVNNKVYIGQTKLLPRSKR